VAILGGILALVAGIGYNSSAAVQKREAVAVGSSLAVTRLLPALVRRKVWVAASLLDLLAWLAQVVALALAPIALVIPVMGLGAAVLVVLGIRWLGERFRSVEIWGIVLVAAGATAAAVAAGNGSVARAPLPFADQIAIGGVALAVAMVLARTKTGIAYGTAAGALYAATAIYTKEVGDRFAVDGAGAVPRLLASPTPWLLAVMAIVALALVQAGFQRANAASVVAAMTAVDTVGPILAGFLLYHESFPSGAAGPVLAVGIAAAVLGTTLLAGRLEHWPAEQQRADPRTEPSERGLDDNPR
jgi:hypothetical protein